MRHEDWQALIPFYIANTLTGEEKHKFEAHLSTCQDCRAEIEEWAVIGSAIRAQAETWGRGLPPLSATVRSQLVSHIPPPPNKAIPFPVEQAQPRRRINLPLTLAAAVIALLVFVGLLVALMNGPSDKSSPVIAQQATATASHAPSATPTNTLPPTHELGVLNAPTATPVPIIPTQPPTAILPPVVPQPTEPLVIASPFVAPTAIPTQPVVLPPPPDVVPPGLGDMGDPDMLEPIEPEALESAAIEAAVMVAPPATMGTVCTLILTPEITTASLYASPTRDSAILTTIASAVEVIGRTELGWNRVWYSDGITTWIGWVYPSDGMRSGACGDIPLLPDIIPTQPPETTPEIIQPE